MEAPQMRGVEEPLLPEPRAVEGGATQSEGAIETQEARYPRLHKTAGLRSLDVWVEISKRASPHSNYRLGSCVNSGGKGMSHLQTSNQSPPHVTEGCLLQHRVRCSLLLSPLPAPALCRIVTPNASFWVRAPFRDCADRTRRIHTWIVARTLFGQFLSVAQEPNP